MRAVHVVSGRGVPLKRSDVDTDQIIPAEWLKRVERTGFEKGLFSTWRDDRNFVLNDERYSGANLFALTNPRAAVGIERWRAIEQDRKKGWRVLLQMGVPLFLGAVLRVRDLHQTARGLRRRLGPRLQGRGEGRPPRWSSPSGTGSGSGACWSGAWSPGATSS